MDEALLKRVPPHSVEAEQSVIGSMLMDREAIIAASEILTADDFYMKQYGVVFDAIMELFNEGKPIDLVVLQERLKEKDVPPEVCSLDFFRDIMNNTVTSANVTHYAQIVRDRSVLRNLIHVVEDIDNSCYAGKESLEDILADTEKNIFELLQSRESREFIPIREIALNVLDKIDQAARSKNPVTGLPTGFTDLDYRLSGLQPSDLILIAARPSMGKTALALNIADYLGVRRDKKCLIFSLEMSREQLVNRLLSMETNVDSQKLRTGTLSDSDWEAVVEGIGTIGNSSLMIDDTPGISVMEVRSKCRKIKLEKGLDLVMIDYLQLMTGNSKGNDNRQQEISEISRSLKALARELDVPVIALSQLSRACELRNDHRPMLSDLRESGAIEQDADVVMFLYRDDYYDKDSENPNVAELIIAKQRNGPIGTINLGWRPELTKFVNLEK